MGETRGARIAKNTIYLYARMLLSMLITLYTSRVILNTLGVSDFGIYNVVTGFVVSFGFLSSAMNASVQRFLTVEMKSKNYDRLNRIFSMGITIHFILAFTIALIAEPVGLYFVVEKLVIPTNRLSAAIWIFHFSVITLFFGIMNIPYKALIIAREDMGAFAAISLIEVFSKLLIAWLIVYSVSDKLIVYGVLLMLVSIAIQLFYMYYCITKYEEGRFRKYWNMQMFKEMSCFAGWNLLGVFAGIVYNQGVNIVLNIFGGPIVNAARAIAFQVSGAANQLVTNFQLAVNPPIMKAYSVQDKSVFRLILSSSKLSYVLLLFIIIPFVIECPLILTMWLKEVPEYSINFSRLAMIDILICSLAGPLHTLIQATGTIKKYQIIVSGILLMNMPFSYFALKLGISYECTFVVSIMLSTIVLVVRYVLLKKYVTYNIIELMKNFVLPIMFLAIVGSILPIAIHDIMDESYSRVILVGLSSWISISVMCWFLVLDASEKTLFLRIIKIK